MATRFQDCVLIRITNKNIYMEQPSRMFSQLHANYVCKIKKALFGLKKLQELGTERLPNTYNFVDMALQTLIWVCASRKVRDFI